MLRLSAVTGACPNDGCFTMERRAEKLKTRTFALRPKLLLAGALVLLAGIGGPLGIRSATADDKEQGNPRAEAVGIVQVREPIPFETIRKPSSELRIGTSRTTRPGAPGEALVTYRVFYSGDREIRREAVSRKVVKAPQSEVIEVGQAATNPSRGRYASRGYFAGRRVLTMIATGYDPSPASNGGYTRTSTGLRIGHGVVAVDPKIIPLGTKLYIEGYGYAVAADVGSAIKGYRIDLGHDTARGARNIGRRVVRVHILN